jgi:hypothetical protein
MRIISSEKIEQRKFVKASATVIPADSLVALSSGLVVAAGASDTKIGYCVGGAVSGVTDVSVVIGNNYEIELNADEVFAATHRGTDVDMVVSGTEQKVDLGSNSVKIFTVEGGADAGTVGEKTNVRVRIADGKALY